MSMSIPKVSYNSMLKEGTRNFQGLEEAVYRNIEGCKQLANVTRTSYGPNGMKKIIVNHLEKLFITKDAATILKELEVEHPAAKLMVLASKMAEQEVGDGTNFVIQLASSLLNGAAELLNFGVTAGDIINGYKLALKKCLLYLPTIVCSEITYVRRLDHVIEPIRSAMSTKQGLYSSFFAELVAKACIQSKPVLNQGFNVDNIRTGGGGLQSEVKQGLVVIGVPSGTVSQIKKAKIAVYSNDFDLMNTETKGTVLLNTANELMSFSKGEENAAKKFVSELKAAGINMVVCSGKAADQLIDFSNRLGIMIVRISSKFELQRLCRATHASNLATLRIPNLEEIGHCDCVEIKEIGDTKVVVFTQENEESAISTIIIRGSSDTLLNDLELSVDDGVNCYKSLVLNGKLLPGAGATEMSLCVYLEKEAVSIVGMEQYALNKFAEAFRSVVRCICDNNGLKTNLVISQLYAEHHEGKTNMGIDIDAQASTCDVTSKRLYDLFYVKSRCLEIAVDVVSTILSVDQIIVARPAGGPQVPHQNPNWDQD